VKRLIINADDFGFTSGVNRAIVEAHTRGVVTSSTLMAKGRAFGEAVELTRTVPKLSIGCHVVLIDGEPVVEEGTIPTLTQDGRFRDGLKSFAARALTGRLDAGELEAEVSAQIQKIQSAGIFVSHLDTHKHTHLFLPILRPLLRAAAGCGVKAVRNPYGPKFPLRSGQLLARPALRRRGSLRGQAGRKDRRCNAARERSRRCPRSSGH